MQGAGLANLNSALVFLALLFGVSGFWSFNYDLLGHVSFSYCFDLGVVITVSVCRKGKLLSSCGECEALQVKA